MRNPVGVEASTAERRAAFRRDAIRIPQVLCAGEKEVYEVIAARIECPKKCGGSNGQGGQRPNGTLARSSYVAATTGTATSRCWGGSQTVLVRLCPEGKLMRGAPCKDRGPRGTRPGAFLPYVAEYYDLLGIMQPGRLTKAWTTASLPLSQSVGSKTVATRKAPPSNRP